MSRPQARIRACADRDFEAIYRVVNDAAEAYRAVIPADRWKEPYMPRAELGHEIAAGVHFYAYEEGGEIIGVMGLQPLAEVALIRHAYVLSARQNQGIGAALLADLKDRTELPMLVGTWAAAGWAIRFYENHGFRLVSEAEKTRLLQTYWSIPERQIETSVVLADERWDGQAEAESN